MNNVCKILIVIPAYNEERSIGAIVSEICNNEGCDVLVVNDDSRDGTLFEAKKAGAKVISHSTRLGAWNAIRSGFRFAAKNGYPVVVTLDGDGQHPVSEAYNIALPVIRDEADLVIGSCVARGGILRKLAWGLLRKISRLNIQDLTSGFRAYNYRAFNMLINDDSALFDYQDIGVLILLKRNGFRFIERPVSMQERAHGKSKVYASWFSIFKYMSTTCILSISEYFSSSASKKENMRK